MFRSRIKSPIQRCFLFVQSIELSKICSFKSLITLFIVPNRNLGSGNAHPHRTPVTPYYCLLMLAVVALFFTSCQKESLDATMLNSTASANSAEARLKLPWQRKSPETAYGALIGAPDSLDNLIFELSVADQLGITCLRERVAVPCRSLSVNLVPELTSGYKVVLNFNTPNSTDDSLLPFVSDLNQYRIDLNNILNTFTVLPEVAVIENEESNRFYYSGTAQEYLTQLSTAIAVMHARGIKVTNGGITSGGLNYLVYLDLLSQGKTDSAEQFKEAANVTPNSPTTQERGAFVEELLLAYASMDLDFVNFHWKATSPDTETFNQVINYLKKRTGKKIISNELGQFDEDPNTLLAHIQMCSDQGFPYMLWYSPDESEGKKGKSLQRHDASLTQSGLEYQEYLQD